VGEGAVIAFADGAVELTEDGVTRRIDLPQAEGYALEVVESYDPPTLPLDENGQGEPYAVFGTAAQMVELEVDMELGTVKLLNFTAAHDVGRAINPLLVEGQIEGGIAQGLGLALMEEFLPGRTENLHDYLIPTIGDVPPVQSIIIESGDAHGPYGAKGLGEHCLIPTAPAVLNAIAHASGARIHHLPATPDRVRAAILAARDQATA
jgi:CO/xanthine dehydrogenase Mo-binding subunit